MPRYVEFLAQLAGDTSSIPVEPCEEDLIDNDFADSVTSVSKISNFREAITSLEDVTIFPGTHKGSYSTETSRLLDVVTTFSVNNSKTLDCFFQLKLSS